ncbi:MAG: hypothetical protein U0325_02805 [Polyangiales bacterium]
MDIAARIPASADVPAAGMDAVLAWCAVHRFTGVLTFSDLVGEVSLPLRAGVVDLDLDPSLAAVAVRVLSTRTGRYTLTEALPPLEGASASHPLRREGTLGPATVADLLRWCDDVALTGTVHLSTRRPEPRSHVFTFDRGVLASVELESWSERELSEVFAVDEGTFVVRLTSRFGATTPSVMPTIDDGRLRREDLRAVRLGLETLLERRDAASSGRWRRPRPERPTAAATMSIPAPPRVPLDLLREDPGVLVYGRSPHQPCAHRAARGPPSASRPSPARQRRPAFIAPAWWAFEGGRRRLRARGRRRDVADLTPAR